MRAFPDHGFYGEEHASLRQQARYQWYVDPIDGTTNFVHGLPLFGISIGLVDRKRIVVGVIYDPMRDELFTAVKGHGAHLNGRRLHVSSTRDIAHSLLSTGFPSEFRRQPQPYLRWFLMLESRSRAVRRIGSTALSLAYIAAGRLEGFYEQRLWPWDIAAGILLVEEAGGCTTNLNGRPPVLEEGQLLATNGRIHQALLRLLKSR
jgi:myo-inositol-1(or 4)-monophosphatase